MISSLILLLALLEPDLLPLDVDDEDDVFDVFDEELGDDVDALLLPLVLLEFAALFALLLLLFELLLPPEDPPPALFPPPLLPLLAEDADADDPPDCFSFLSLIIVIGFMIFVFTQFSLNNTFSLFFSSSLSESVSQIYFFYFYFNYLSATADAAAVVGALSLSLANSLAQVHAVTSSCS